MTDGRTGRLVRFLSEGAMVPIGSLFFTTTTTIIHRFLLGHFGVIPVNVGTSPPLFATLFAAQRIASPGRVAALHATVLLSLSFHHYYIITITVLLVLLLLLLLLLLLSHVLVHRFMSRN